MRVVSFVHRPYVIGVLAAGLLWSASADPAEAGSLLCPESLGTGITRQLKIDWIGSGTAECAFYGNVNLPQTDPYLYDSPSVPGGPVAFDLIEKDIDPNNVGGNVTPGGDGQSGTFTINLPASEYLLGFKFGGGSGDPDWFIIYLSGITTGQWSFGSGEGNGLSHMNIWGDPPPPDRHVTPEPASMLLLGSGLAGLYARRRRRA